MDLGLKGRRALVTGASKGLGKAVAAALSAEGAAVAICARDPNRTQAAAREIGAVGIVADLSVVNGVEPLLRQAIERLGGIDILVVNTGGPLGANFDGVTDDMWRLAFEGLWISTVQLIRGSLPGMKKRRWGRILVVTSVSAVEPLPNLAISNALRPGLHGLLNDLSREVAKHGVTVNALMPGYTATERLRDLGIDDAKVAATVPAQRLGRPEEFAALATFLASEPAGYICGQAIACDGGYLRSI
jgi:3-oxoacyl-[acyl-carrier protein] reductase